MNKRGAIGVGVSSVAQTTKAELGTVASWKPKSYFQVGDLATTHQEIICHDLLRRDLCGTTAGRRLDTTISTGTVKASPTCLSHDLDHRRGSLRLNQIN
jgi:hypothetical protein